VTDAKPRKRHARKRTDKTRQKRAWAPSPAHRRILQAGLELLAKSGWPSMAAMATVVGTDKSTVHQHFEHPAFAAWFNERMDAFVASCRPKARAKFAALAMAGSVPHFVELGWSEARRGPTIHTDGSVELAHDGPIPIVINSLVPRPPKPEA
jgi:hypothetical protein